MALTLDWLINRSSLNNLKCLTNTDILSVKIDSVNILDNPDVLKWIKKDELVITTGYIFKDSEDLQFNILRELKNIGCSGLGIKNQKIFWYYPRKYYKCCKWYWTTYNRNPFLLFFFGYK